MRERVIEKYLHKQVTAAGGTTRKMKGRTNDPDRLVIWPVYGFDGVFAVVDFVETKSTEGRARAGQLREHKRLRELGARVEVINTKALVDAYVADRG